MYTHIIVDATSKTSLHWRSDHLNTVQGIADENLDELGGLSVGDDGGAGDDADHNMLVTMMRVVILMMPVIA